MPFLTSGPVSGELFYDRQRELGDLLTAVQSLKADTPRYYALLGMRKVGKTSLLIEFTRRLADDPSVVVVHVDCFESAIDPLLFFQDYAVAVLDAFLDALGYTAQIGTLRGARLDAGDFLAALGRIQALGLRSMERGVRALLALRASGDRREAFHAIADLPEAVAVEVDRHVVVILDEFQALRRLNAFKDIKTTVADVFQLLRSKWQQQRHVMYVISGSEISLLEQIIHHEQAPFFQHFTAVRLGTFPQPEAQAMMATLFAQAGHHVDQALIDEMVSRFNSQPFYLQVLGEELCRAASDPAIGSITPALYKTVAQDTLFGQGGRLYLYFQGMYERVVGSATSLARVLIAVARGCHTVSEVARELRRGSNVVSSWLGRLVDTDVLVKEGTHYRFGDPVLALWVQGTRPPFDAIGGPYLIGDETERRVAYAAGREGFRLAFQSRASRGAFDLLALLNTTQIGIQVKYTAGWPLYVPASEMERMRDWADRLGWVPVLCVVRQETIRYYHLDDLSRTDGSYRVDDGTLAYETLLRLLAADG